MRSPAGRLRGMALVLHALLIVALPFLAGVAGALLALPLLAPLPGLWRGRPYTFAWCSMLIVLYAGGFVMEMIADPSVRTPATILAAAAVLEFAALVLFVRVSAAQRRAATAG